ncbi:K+ transporter-like protein [Paraburkholderia graminis C4D1M]|uniref:K+ transporter-like protein n=1 Tax=Paraburkholderia graminis (strain ATCC 700544 / DSM 17151 / LMG 18924 / NCIMB 13744 / C4D1M) TaxID=396598 RepID=B1G5W6_PARG4|nr:K+ transporter-like protein [Paraburkholderia graminis C4D1M]
MTDNITLQQTAILVALAHRVCRESHEPACTRSKSVQPVAWHSADRSIHLGVISLLFWAIVIVVGIKYVLFVMRADNNGEGRRARAHGAGAAFAG